MVQQRTGDKNLRPGKRSASLLVCCKFERNRLGYTKLWGVLLEKQSSNMTWKRRSKGGAVHERVIGYTVT